MTTTKSSKQILEVLSLGQKWLGGGDLCTHLFKQPNLIMYGVISTIPQMFSKYVDLLSREYLQVLSSGI